jgi:hypothetical protein
VGETAGDGRRREGDDESQSSTPSFLREGDAALRDGGPPPARKRVRPARQDQEAQPPDLSVEVPVTPTADTGTVGR